MARTLACVVLGAAALTATAFYAAPLLQSGQNGKESSAVSTEPAENRVAIGFGHVDVENGPSRLYPQQPGRVVRIDAVENKLLKKGDLVLQVDDELQRDRVTEAEADVKAAQAQLDQAEKLPAQHARQVEQQKQAVEVARQTRDGAQSLFEKADRLSKSAVAGPGKEERAAALAAVNKAEAGIKAEEAKLAALELFNPKLEVDRARSNLAAKQARLKQAQFAVEECKLRAPVDGAVLRLQVAIGDVLGPNPTQPIVWFCPSEKRIVRTEIEQEFADRVRPGEPVEIKDFARLSGRWTGKVKSISDWYTPRRSILLEPRQFNDVRTIECIIELDSDRDLKIGQRMLVTIGK
jgi:multidrug resistance efflux pump